MTSIITGDVVNSRQFQEPKTWLDPLKNYFQRYGTSPQLWEIFRGDSFQLEIKNPEEVVSVSLGIKIILKKVEADIRIGIGIGEKNHEADKISESNGQAFIFSGETFDALKKEKQSLRIKTPWSHFDEEINVYIRLLLIIMDGWTAATAEYVALARDYPSATQEQIANKLKVTQSSVSDRKQRSHYDDIKVAEDLVRKKIKQHLST